MYTIKIPEINIRHHRSGQIYRLNVKILDIFRFYMFKTYKREGFGGVITDT